MNGEKKKEELSYSYVMFKDPVILRTRLRLQYHSALGN